MRKIRIIFLLAAIFLVSYLYLNPKHDSKVLLTSTGFEPNVITIKKGDSVTFFTSNTNLFWPASNPHPNHNLYGDFDPKRALKPNETWTFSFTESGSWSYHDHLNPRFTGVVNVIERNLLSKLIKQISDFWTKKIFMNSPLFINRVVTQCGTISQSNRESSEGCWSDVFISFLKEFGPEKTLNLIQKLTNKKILSVSDCHNYADEIGLASYWIYQQKSKFNLSSQFEMCNFGFFHGFMLEHVSHGYDLSDSVAFCDSISFSTESLFNECYVGLGSGLTYLFLDEGLGNIDNSISKSLNECSKIGSFSNDCTYGVYGGLEHLLLGAHGIKIELDQKNPYKICSLQKDLKYKDYCYERITRPFFSSLDNDLDKIVFYINKIEIPAIRNKQAKIIGMFFVQFETREDNKILIEALGKCERFGLNLFKSCADGAFETFFSNLKQAGAETKDYCLGIANPSLLKSCKAMMDEIL